jgi:hypothetical protein
MAAKLPDKELWLAFLRDPDGNLVGLMEAPDRHSVNTPGPCGQRLIAAEWTNTPLVGGLQGTDQFLIRSVGDITNPML